MKSPVAVVCGKEILDNARERRTLFSTLVFGPLFGPALFAILVNVMLSQTLASFEQRMSLPVNASERAPNLLAFLAERGIDAEPGPATLLEAVEAVESRQHELVLVVDEQYPEAFRTGRAARLTLVFDQSDTAVGGRLRRVESVLNAWNERLRVLRIVARGIDPAVLRPVTVDEVDVSTPAARSVLLLGMLTYFLLLATLMGGFYLAIDTTAGERERGSLEPLLSAPVSRETLLAGKMLATTCYMLLSLALTVTGFAVALNFVSLEPLGMSSTLSAPTALAIFAVLVPFAPLGAGLMTLVASFTNSYKEAQTYLTIVLLVPTLPLVFATLLDVRPAASLMWIPSLSQHLLVTTLLRQESVAPLHLALSVGGTLAVGALLTWLATLFYRRERLIG